MRLTSEVSKLISSQLADFSNEVNKSPITVGHWMYRRPHMFLKIENYVPLKNYVQTDNIDDLFEFESEEEKETLLNKYRTLRYEQAATNTTLKE
nr:MAG TPA: hypothetical protein [Caudoviricetes sp.]